MMNNKGQVGQIATFIVIIFVVGLTIILCGTILNEFYDAMEETGFETVKSIEAKNAMKSNFLMFDYGMLLLAFGLMVGLMITSFLIPTHPIFMVINVVGIFFLIFIGMVTTNVYAEFVSGEAALTNGIGDTADDFIITNGIIQYLPWLASIAIFITSVVMYAKGQGGNY